ncbi:MAG: peroxidase-related enzyme [Emcibacteraceae bacterium]|nr:peroxidase-related enzyme [Emcibacteraceae bacterium]
MTAWIEMIEDADATGAVKEMYDIARSPHGTVDNVMRCHSLRPHTMAGHLAIYKSVLHNPDNIIPFWFLEVVASYTSIVNKCKYSLTHHFMNARRLINDKEKSDAIYAALQDHEPERMFNGKELALLNYTKKLTASVAKMVASDMEPLRNAGCDDGEILEVNQVVAYFNYSNRVLNGLGVTTEGDVIGYYSEDK